MIAGGQGSLDAVMLLIQQGASVPSRDDKGCTALQYAIEKKQLEIAQRLIVQWFARVVHVDSLPE